MITHCPSCELSFRISESQLGAAGGLVRCGVCLKVFNANDDLSSEPQEFSPQELSSPAPVDSSPPRPPSLSAQVDDDFFIDDNFDLALLERLTGAEPSPQQEVPPPQPEKTGCKDMETPPMDGQSNNPELDRTSTKIPPHHPGSPESAAPATPSAAQRNQSLGNSGANGSDNRGIDGPALTLADIPRNLATPLFDADDLADQDDGGRSRTQWLWYPALLITLAALPLQYAYFHADILGQDPRWRPAMEVLCRVTPCTLAPLTSLSRIATTDLVVRSHPDQVGALRVDATLLNRAPFAQPFPHLLLSFANLAGEVVAARTFPPDTYLGGELEGAKLMPIRQPVKLELDILDPGLEAVSYSLTVTDSGRQ